jgi:hypothetical protein
MATLGGQVTIGRTPDSLDVSSSRGSISVLRLKPDTLLYRFEGYLSEEMFDPSMVFANAAIARYPKVDLMGDGERWFGYEPGYRRAWTKWFLAHRKQVRAAHLMSKSPIVRMGAQVINLALGAGLLHIHKERVAFDALVADLSPPISAH